MRAWLGKAIFRKSCKLPTSDGLAGCEADHATTLNGEFKSPDRIPWSAREGWLALERSLSIRLVTAHHLEEDLFGASVPRRSQSGRPAFLSGWFRSGVQAAAWQNPIFRSAGHIASSLFLARRTPPFGLELETIGLLVQHARQTVLAD